MTFKFLSKLTQGSGCWKRILRAQAGDHNLSAVARTHWLGQILLPHPGFPSINRRNNIHVGFVVKETTASAVQQPDSSGNLNKTTSMETGTT